MSHQRRYSDGNRRNQRRKSGYSRWPNDNPDYDATEALIGERGVSVFRRVSPGVLDETIRKLTAKCNELGIANTPVGSDPEYPPALILVQMVEVRLNRRRLGNLAAQETLDTIYKNVPTLRRKAKVRVVGAALFGNANSRHRPIGITFEEQCRLERVAERTAVRAEFEELSEGQHPDPIEWIRSEKLQIPLSAVDTGHPNFAIKPLYRVIAEVFPSVFMLQPATMHNPNK